MARTNTSSLVLLLAAVGVAAADNVTVTPWCANSLRVQIMPAGAVAKPTPGALKNRVSVALEAPSHRLIS